MKNDNKATCTSSTPHTLAQLVVEQEATSGRKIGLLGNYHDTEETRFLLTPEACGMLTSSGMKIFMERDAAIDIDFMDEKYMEYGVEIVSRKKALKCDIVLSYTSLKAADIAHMNDGAVLLTMMDNKVFNNDVINTLLEKKITYGCFDNMVSHNDQYIFSNIIDEIDGRAAVMYAEYALSFLDGGKGVLLGGVAGVMPCEVLIIGNGGRVCAAARAALNTGAQVTLMDNDISSLQDARDACGPGLVTAAIHPRVLFNKVQSADVIISDNCTRTFEMPKELEIAMKENVYKIDFTRTQPSVCVPRTVAMSLSNMLINFFQEMVIKNGFEGMLMATPGVQAGIVTYRGQLTDKLIGTYTGIPATDIAVMLTGRN